MAKIMLKMISLIFQSIESFVLNLPSCAGAFGQFHNIILIYDNIRHPTVFVCDLTFVNELILKTIYVVGILCAI